MPSQKYDEAPPAKKKKKNVEFNRLDATTVHPESYELAEKILRKANVDIDKLKNEESKRKLYHIKVNFTYAEPNHFRQAVLKSNW